jgi:hypothetical protein
LKAIKFMGLRLGVSGVENVLTNMRRGEPFPWVSVGQSIGGSWFANATFAVGSMSVRDRATREGALRALRKLIRENAPAYRRVCP